jgi:hypothetical protein
VTQHGRRGDGGSTYERLRGLKIILIDRKITLKLIDQEFLRVAVYCSNR